MEDSCSRNPRIRGENTAGLDIFGRIRQLEFHFTEGLDSCDSSRRRYDL